MIKNKSVKYSILNNTQKRHVGECFCHFLKTVKGRFINKNFNIGYVTSKSTGFDKSKSEMFFRFIERHHQK